MYYLPKDVEDYVHYHPKEISEEMRKIRLLKECRSGNKRSFKLLDFFRKRFLSEKAPVGKTHSRPV